MLMIHGIRYSQSAVPRTVFEEACRDIDSSIIQMINEAIQNRNSFNERRVENLSTELNSRIAIFDNILSEYSFRYWNKAIGVPIDPEEAFAAFLHELLKNLAKPSKLFTFIKTTSGLRNSLINVLNTVKFAPDFLVSYSASCLYLLSQLPQASLNASIRYHFTEGVAEIVELREKGWDLLIHDLIMSNPIFRDHFISVLSTTGINSNASNLSKFIYQATNKTFIIDLICPDTYAITTFHLYIFIKQHFKSEAVNLGATVICFMHELCHYLMRVNCQSAREVKKKHTPYVTPKKINAVDTPQMPPRGESGFDLEKALFGGMTVAHINVDAADYLLGLKNCVSIQEFQNTFNALNINREIQHITLGRGQGEAELGKCPMRLMDSSDED